MKGFKRKRTKQYVKLEKVGVIENQILREINRKKGKPNIAGSRDLVLCCLRVCTKSRESKKGDRQCRSPFGLLKQKSTDGVTCKQ